MEVNQSTAQAAAAEKRACCSKNPVTSPERAFILVTPQTMGYIAEAKRRTAVRQHVMIHHAYEKSRTSTSTKKQNPPVPSSRLHIHRFRIGRNQPKRKRVRIQKEPPAPFFNVSYLWNLAAKYSEE